MSDRAPGNGVARARGTHRGLGVNLERQRVEPLGSIERDRRDAGQASICEK
jgi:hypothetical protein